MNTKSEELGYKSLTQCVMDFLKDKLSKGELQPGEEINLTAVSETLGVSRSPVREALIQLVKEGFVDAAERRRFRIRKLTPAEVKDLYEIGGILEGEIVRDTCGVISDAELENLEGYLKGIQAALEANDPKAFLEGNGEFNKQLWRFCGNRILVEFFGTVRERLYFSAKRADTDEWNRMLFEDHREIVRLLRARDPQAIERLVREKHWSYSRNLPFITRFYRFAPEKER